MRARDVPRPAGRVQLRGLQIDALLPGLAAVGVSFVQNAVMGEPKPPPAVASCAWLYAIGRLGGGGRPGRHCSWL